MDQSLSSVTNFALTLLAARALGPSGLGVVAVGFALYVAALGFYRAGVSQPFVVSSTGKASSERTSQTRSALTVSLSVAIALSALLVLVGFVSSGVVARACVLYAPWLGVLLIQDFWRSVLFRDGRGSAAALNDGVWLGTFLLIVLALPISWSEGSVVGAWGAGGALAAAIGIGQAKVAPSSPARAWRWWRTEARALGRWLIIEEALFTATAQATVFLVAAALGTAAVGGLRAVQTVFAPLSLLGPALSLPLLPLMTSTRAISASSARLLGAKTSGLLTALTLAYLLVAGVVVSGAIARLFGHNFAQYNALLIPVGAQQLMLALGTGPQLFLKASRAGKALARARAAASIATLLFVVLAAHLGSLELVAWSLAAGSAVWTGLLIASSLGLPRTRDDSLSRPNLPPAATHTTGNHGSSNPTEPLSTVVLGSKSE